MKSNCAAIIASGRKCYTIGTKFLWTAGGWPTIATCGRTGSNSTRILHRVHMYCEQRNVKWTDDREKESIANRRELIDRGAFVDNHQNYSWLVTLPFIVNGEAAAIPKGNFAVAPLREAALDDSKLDFCQFPAITEGGPMAEDAPTDTFHIASNAANKDNAREFLRFVVTANVQSEINNGNTSGNCL